jgi:dTDP-4-dehydrorhamnose 3,5-epimerase
MHDQKEPHGEVKLVRCTKGKVFDVVIDMRPDSSTFKKWHSEELSEDNHKAMYIPAGCAHGFLSLTDNTEVLYMMSGAYDVNAATGVRWNDPSIGIEWPAEPAVLSDRDAQYPDISE